MMWLHHRITKVHSGSHDVDDNYRAEGWTFNWIPGFFMLFFISKCAISATLSESDREKKSNIRSVSSLVDHWLISNSFSNT